MRRRPDGDCCERPRQRMGQAKRTYGAWRHRTRHIRTATAPRALFATPAGSEHQRAVDRQRLHIQTQFAAGRREVRVVPAGTRVENMPYQQATILKAKSRMRAIGNGRNMIRFTGEQRMGDIGSRLADAGDPHGRL